MTKLIYGVGLNSKTKYPSTRHGKHTAGYRAWRNMLERCYSAKLHFEKPTYLNASMSSDFFDFQDFANWYYNHPYSEIGYDLDKDILIPGNKVYSPDTCCFIPHELNSLLTDSGKSRGRYPQGVKLDKRSGKFTCQINKNGKIRHIGTFLTCDDAYEAYKLAKEEYVKERALEWRDAIASDVFNALMRWRLGV